MMSDSVSVAVSGTGAPGGVTVGADFTGGCPLRLVAAGGVLK
jgi:hypothetical protein